MAAELLADAAEGAAALEPVAVGIFLTAGAVIVTAELYGVFRKGRRGDTISELLWYVRDRSPLPVRAAGAVAFAASLGWLWWHLVFGG